MKWLFAFAATEEEYKKIIENIGPLDVQWYNPVHEEIRGLVDPDPRVGAVKKQMMNTKNYFEKSLGRRIDEFLYQTSLPFMRPTDRFYSGRLTI